jgi:uncharacterized membrane protein
VSYIILGCIIFLTIHLLSLCPTKRSLLIDKFGLNKFKGVYALIAFLGLILMLTARFSSGEYVKDASDIFYELRFFLMYLALVFIVAAEIPANHIKKFSRHPMLIGISIWSFSHFMVNQHLNHLILFSFFFFFSLIMLFGIIVRDKQKIFEVQANGKMTSLTLLVATVAFVFITFFHGFIAGIDLI